MPPLHELAAQAHAQGFLVNGAGRGEHARLEAVRQCCQRGQRHALGAKQLATVEDVDKRRGHDAMNSVEMESFKRQVAPQM